MEKIHCIEAENLTDVLSKQYIIPDYQRKYSWGKDESETLWEDVLDNSNEGYLLGSIVVIKKNDCYEVVDGQQRLVTLTLMFCAIRDHLHENIKDDIPSKKTLFKRINEKISNIKLNENDYIIFRKIKEDTHNIKKDSIFRVVDGQLYESQNKIFSNYKYFCDKFASYCKLQEFDFDGNIEQVIEDIREIIEHVSNRIIFSFIIALKEDHAFQIFEALNTTGQRLTQANMIKNYLLKKSDTKKDENRARWDQILNPFKDKDHDGFLYDSLLSRNANGKISSSSSNEHIPINKKNLYKIIKKICQNNSDITSYLNQLEEDKECASHLRNPDTMERNEWKKVKKVFTDMKLINAKYIRVPILAASRRFDVSSEEFRILSECLLIFFFKFKIIHDGDPDAVREISKEVTKSISDKKNIKEIIKLIIQKKDLMMFEKRISDDCFIQDFKKYSHNSKSVIAKYILMSIERYLRVKDSSDLDINYDEFELEHILPKNHKKWDIKDFFARYEHHNQDIGIFKERLGNMTLLQKPWNRSMQDETFDIKLNGNAKIKKGYKHSDLKINKNYLASYTLWDAKTVEQREDELRKLANKIWNEYEYSDVQKYLPDDT